MSVEFEARSAVAAAFLCGWASSSTASLPLVPQIIAEKVGLAAVTLDVIDRNGTPVLSHRHPKELDMQGGLDDDTLRFEAPLDAALTLRLAGTPAPALEPLAAEQMELFRHLASLIHGVLGCILVQQHDRRALGQPFDRLSVREWEVCRALEGLEKEEKIAATLQCSPNTLHCHVRRIYKKIGVKGRKELVALLFTARQRVQQRTLKRLGRRDRSGETAEP